FFMRRTAEQEHAVLLTVEADGTERVLVDPCEIDPSGLTTLDSWQPSKEGALLAYQLSEGGTEESVVRVLDVRTGEQVDGPIDRARYTPIAWLPGGTAYYYVRRLAPELLPAGEEQFHRRVWLHRVGTSPEEDALVFGEGRKATEYFGVSVSRDGQWLQISAAEGTAPRNDLWVAHLPSGPLEAPALIPVQVDVDAQTGLEFCRDGRVLVSTDRDAPRGRLCVTDPADPTYEQWRDLVPQDPEAVLEGYAVLDGPELDRPVLLTSWTRHAVSELAVHDLATGERLGSVGLPGLGTIGGIIERPEGGHEAWFGYTDHTTTSTVLRYDALSGETSVWAAAPGSVEVPGVQTRQVTYDSADGTQVRMFVIAPAGAEPDRPRPTVLYGYGGFGLSLTPGYSASILAWVEAGGVWAVAGLRGGGEEGEQWHRDGMLANKHHVFEDFHAAAQWLVSAGWTTPEQLAIQGGSNGGLLVGAALTQRPDLYRAVVCSAPLLDMVRYERFGLGATWNVEYGSAEDAEELEWLLGYSPYHHVADETDYPAVLFTVFDGDSRVDPLHARKMTAALQHATSGTRPILLRAEPDVGHGARAVSRSLDLAADVLAFTAYETGLALPD
ncbi:MAG TPA: prolyl oligopeptidase family serine peptidase, partial [Actinomycetes bacterium]|nr:prolyl oligopeptidase family serine peptidase [Actinomycetes bacterium]